MTKPHGGQLPEGDAVPPEPGLDTDPDLGDDDRGSVFVNWISLEENFWVAVWDRGQEHRSLERGTRDQAIAWARSQEASHHWIFSSELDDWVPSGTATDEKEST